jgi:superfamily II DNA/RNA helicase
MAARRSSSTPAQTDPERTTHIAESAFGDLGVPPALVEVLAGRGITVPSAIQAATLPDSLAGRDVLGRARTGSGKTYAFLLPVLARLAASGKTRRPGRPRALILAPTRELATQIEAAAAPLAKALSMRTLTVFGGVPRGRQLEGLRAGVDVLVACPGRLDDHLSTGGAHLDAVEVTVLDEADHMAELGFLPVVLSLLKRIPRDGQRLLFSATLDNDLEGVVKRYLNHPVTHSLDPVASPVSVTEHHLLRVSTANRIAIVADLAAAPGRTLVFTRTKRGAARLTKQLGALGVEAVELHGNLVQSRRTRNLTAFTHGRVTTLVATDIAARGIHVDDVERVVHADPPVEHKAYLHRSGRTARAGASGTVITLMTDAQADGVRELVRKAGITPIVTGVGIGHPLLTELAPGERVFGTPPPRAEPARPTGNRRTGTSTATARPARRNGPAASGGSSSGGAAAFSAATRAGSRRSR